MLQGVECKPLKEAVDVTALDGWMSVAQAAERLGVSAEHVRELAASGRLTAAKPGRDLLIKSDAVHRRLHVEKPRPSQPWSPRMAWAVLAVTSGDRPGWVSSSELVRAKRYALRPLEQWPWLLSKRADVHRVRMLVSQVRRLTGMSGVSVGGVQAANHHGAGLVASDDSILELYGTEQVFVELKEMRGVGWASNNPNVTVRVLPAGLSRAVSVSVLTASYVPKAVAAADLLDIGDERSVGAAAELLDRA